MWRRCCGRWELEVLLDRRSWPSISEAVGRVGALGTEHQIDDRWVVSLDDRQTTLKERDCNLGTGSASAADDSCRLRDRLVIRFQPWPNPRLIRRASRPLGCGWADVVLISDYGKGVSHA